MLVYHLSLVESLNLTKTIFSRSYLPFCFPSVTIALLQVLQKQQVDFSFLWEEHWNAPDPVARGEPKQKVSHRWANVSPTEKQVWGNIMATPVEAIWTEPLWKWLAAVFRWRRMENIYQSGKYSEYSWLEDHFSHPALPYESMERFSSKLHPFEMLNKRGS